MPTHVIHNSSDFYMYYSILFFIFIMCICILWAYDSSPVDNCWSSVSSFSIPGYTLLNDFAPIMIMLWMSTYKNVSFERAISNSVDIYEKHRLLLDFQLENISTIQGKLEKKSHGPMLYTSSGNVQCTVYKWFKEFSSKLIWGSGVHFS